MLKISHAINKKCLKPQKHRTLTTWIFSTNLMYLHNSSYRCRIRECLNSNHLKSMLLLRNYSYESSLLCPFSYTCSLYVHRVDDINHFFGQLYHTVSIGGRKIRILFKYILLQMSWLSYWVSKNQSFTHIKDCLSPRVKF